MNITMRQLKVFETAARLLSFTHAARELFLSQPAVSMQIKQLEAQLDLRLFEQLGKRLYLTEAGKEVLAYARGIGQQVDELEAVLNRIKGLSGGRLRISVATTANYFIPSLLGNFSRRYPDVVVTLDVTNRQTLLRQLSENTVELVIMGQPPTEADVVAEAFMDNPLVVVAPPDHPLAKKKKIPLQQLQEEVFLVREPGSGTRIAMERFFTERGMQLHTGMEVGSNEAIKQSVQARLGLGLLSRATIEQELTLKRLTVLNIQDFPIMRHWFMVHRRGKRLSPVAQAFHDFVLAEAKGLVGASGSSSADS